MIFRSRRAYLHVDDLIRVEFVCVDCAFTNRCVAEVMFMAMSPDTCGVYNTLPHVPKSSATQAVDTYFDAN